MMTHAATAGQGVRATLTVIEATLDNGRAFHFAAHDLLSGSNNNLWFPCNTVGDLFSEVERVLVMNHVAVNVVRLDPVSTFPGGGDWRVVYNRKVPAVAERRADGAEFAATPYSR